MNNLEANSELVVDNLLNEIANLHRKNAILSALVTQLKSEQRKEKEVTKLNK